MLMIQELNNLISPVASVYPDVYLKLLSGPSVSFMLVCGSTPLIRLYHALALKAFKRHCE